MISAILFTAPILTLASIHAYHWFKNTRLEVSNKLKDNSERKESMHHSGTATIIVPGKSMETESSESVISCVEQNPWKLTFFFVIPAKQAVVFFNANREDIESVIRHGGKPVDLEGHVTIHVDEDTVDFEPNVDDDSPASIFLTFGRQELLDTFDYFNTSVETKMEEMVDEGLEEIFALEDLKPTRRPDSTESTESELDVEPAAWYPEE